MLTLCLAELRIGYFLSNGEGKPTEKIPRIHKLWWPMINYWQDAFSRGGSLVGEQLVFLYQSNRFFHKTETSFPKESNLYQLVLLLNIVVFNCHI